MNKTIEVTQKLLKIVKQRKTPLVVNKQENTYKKNRNLGKNLSYESYSYDSND